MSGSVLELAALTFLWFGEASACPMRRRFYVCIEYRVGQLLADLGWVDFDHGSSPGTNK